MSYTGEHQNTDTLTWQQRVILGGAFVALLGVLLVLVGAMLMAHQQTSGITPAPVPNAPAVPAEPAPLGPPTVLIPDNA